MFRSARLKLTAWYLLIILLISGLFSIVIYSGIDQEYDRMEQGQRQRQERFEQRYNVSYEDFVLQMEAQGQPIPPPLVFDTQVFHDARMRIQTILLLVNLGILLLAGIAGYFLAGRTLKPIKEMLDEQNRFVTDASHELRTPLTSLKSEIEVYLRDPDLQLPEAKKILKSNLEEVNNLQYLSDNLIKLTQHEKGPNLLKQEIISLKEIIKDALHKVTKLAKNKGITINDTTTNKSFIADKLGLTEVFVILLDNAIKYSDNNTEILLSSHVTDASLVITVKDQGIGITKKDLPHLFDRFYRADAAREKTTTQGYGLGLAIAKQIIDKHQGTIRVASTLGKGATFTIKLPTK